VVLGRARGPRQRLVERRPVLAQLVEVGVEVGDDSGLEPENLRFCLEALLMHPPFVGAKPVIRRTAGDGDVTWPYKIDPQRSITENEVIVATRLAGDRITARRVGLLEQMGSTVAVLRFSDDRAVIGHVGDSRVYRLRAGALAQLTVDHSLVSQMIAAGMAPDASFPWRHVITRALGMPAAEPDVQTAAVLPGDAYLLCSDGLYEPLSEQTIAALLDASPKDACKHLVDAAYAAGSRDNISAIVVRAC